MPLIALALIALLSPSLARNHRGSPPRATSNRRRAFYHHL